MSDPGVDHVRSLERGLAVLTSFSSECPALTASAVAHRTGLTPGTARRLLLTLERLGYVRSDGRQFMLRPRALDVGYAYLSALPVADIALPFLEELSRRFNESASCAVLDEHEIVYVARVPAHATSLGRVLLAGLAPDALDGYFSRARLSAITDRTITDEAALRQALCEIRRSGWAIIDQELEIGVRSVAVPLLDRRGVAAAMNVSAHAGRVSLEQLRDAFLPPMLDAAASISLALRGR
jgi:IclR family transcriptional regulator, pca regulon regulatory protein